MAVDARREAINLLVADARERLMGKTWGHLLMNNPTIAYKIGARLDHVLRFILAHHEDTPYALDVLVWGGFPWTYRQGPPSHKAARFQVAATQDLQTVSVTGGSLWISFDEHKLTPGQQGRARYSQATLMRSIVMVDYFVWRQARRDAGLKDLGETQTELPGLPP